VGDASLLERVGLDNEARALIDAGGGELCGEAHLHASSLSRSSERELQHARGNAATAPCAFDGYAADFRALCVEQQPERADHQLTVWLERDDVQGLCVVPIDLFSSRHPLFVAEDLLADT
jgi:hypothetical protein